MTTEDASRLGRAFARIELVCVLAALALLAALAVPTLAGAGYRTRSQMVECANNLRQIGMGLHLWANDNGDVFPWNTIRFPSGVPYGRATAVYFQIASNHIGSSSLMVCPSDGAQLRTRYWDLLEDDNLSYSVGLHANLARPHTWLSAERNLNGTIESCRIASVSATRVSLTNNPAWDITIHVSAGNVLLAEGSVSRVSNLELTNFVARAVAQDPDGIVHMLTPR